MPADLDEAKPADERERRLVLRADRRDDAGDALAACVSGSGSAVFGLFASEDGAHEAEERLGGDAPWVAVARLTPEAGPDRIMA